MDNKALFGIPCSVIMDPVHGGIKIHPHEKAVIDHPLFQRLRHVTQTSLLSGVFPGCTHTRFEHSIGTMQVAGKVFRNLLRSYLRGQKFEIILEQARGTLQALYYCFRLAALLHDTGHAPFSHQLEECSAVKEILCPPKEVLDSLWDNQNWREIYKYTPDRLEHEHYSVRCAAKILADVSERFNLPIEARDALSIMDKTSVNVSDSIKSGLKPLAKAFGISLNEFCKSVFDLLRSLISGELDVDKMDYMLRDSYYSGCKFGLYSLDHLISSLRIGFDDNWIGLAIAEKGLGAMEDFVYSRFQLYSQIYSHKTAVGLSWLLDEAVSEVMREREQQVKDFLTKIEKFELFFESFFWECFREIAERFPNSACGRLLRREKLNYVDSAVNFPDSFAKRMSEDSVIIESKSKFSKICLSYDRIRVLAGPKGSRRLGTLSQHSDFFEKFKDTRLVHVYEKPKLQSVVQSDDEFAEKSFIDSKDEADQTVL